MPFLHQPHDPGMLTEIQWLSSRFEGSEQETPSIKSRALDVYLSGLVASVPAYVDRTPFEKLSSST